MMATIAAQELTHALVNPTPAAPFSTIGTTQLRDLLQLAAIFDAALPGDVPTSNPSPSTAPSPTGPPSVPSSTPGPPHVPHHTPVTTQTNRYITPRVTPSIVPHPMSAPIGVPYLRVHAQADPHEGEPILGVNFFDSLNKRTGGLHPGTARGPVQDAMLPTMRHIPCPSYVFP
jgi:hypothetical protein